MKKGRCFDFIIEKDVIIIYGAGRVGNLVTEVVLRKFSNKKIYVAVTQKNDGTLESIGNIPIKEISELVEHTEDSTVLIATLPKLHDEINTVLVNLGFRDVVPINDELYEFFCTDYIHEHSSFNLNRILKYKQRILFCPSDNCSTSGAFLAMTELCTSLQVHGVGVAVILPDYGDGEVLLRERDIPYKYIRSIDWCIPITDDDSDCIGKWKEKYHKYNKEAISQIRDLIEEYHVSLVHSNTTYAQIGILAAEAAGIPCVWHFRENIRFQGFDFFDIEYARELIDMSAKKIFVSDYIRDIFNKVMDKDAIVLHDVVQWKNRKYRKILISDEIQLVIVGAINENKSQIDLIKACKILKDIYGLKFHLNIVGKGDSTYVSRLMEYVNSNRLNRNITFCGNRNDVRDILEKSDVAFTCSKSESFGRVTVEGQLAGCLVIGANSGATGELISDQKTGILYKLGNVEELAEKIREVAINRENGRKIAYVGQEYAWSTYSIEKYSNSILMVYDTMLR